MDNLLHWTLLFFLFLSGIILCKFFSSKGNLQRTLLTSLAFYLALAAAVLSISFISSNSVIPVIVASGVISLGILIWSFEWKIEKLRAVDKKNSTRLSWVRIFSVMCALSVLISLLYARPLPWLGERAIEVGQSVKEILPSYDKINERIRNRLTDDPSDQEKSTDISKGFGDRRELPKSGSITLSEDEIMYLRIPGKEDFEGFISRPNYVRSRVLDKYTGDAWELSANNRLWRNDDSDGLKDGWVILDQGSGILHEIFLPSSIGPSIPSIQNPIGFKLDSVLDSGSNNYDTEFRGAIRYQAISNPLFWDQSDESLTPGNNLKQYTSRIGGNLGRRVRLLINEIVGFDFKTPHQKLNLVLAHLRENYKYSTEVENSENIPPMENFLFNEKSGWCDYFASAGAILAREVGFPSRTAYGYSGGVSYKKDQIITYRSKDAHSWAEVFVKNVGWVVLDATPPGSGAAVASEKKLGNSNLPAPEFFRDANIDDVEIVDQAAEVERKKPNSLFIWLAVLLGICVILLIRQLLASLATKIPDAESENAEKNHILWDKNSPPYLIEFLKICIDCGRPKSKGETVREAINNIRDLIKEDNNCFDSLLTYHYSTQYAGASRDRTTESQLKRAFKRLRKNRN